MTATTTPVTPIASSNTSSDSRAWIDDVVRDMLMRKAGGDDIAPEEVNTIIGLDKAENAYIRTLVVTKHKLITAPEFDKLVRRKLVISALGEFPETASHFLEIVSKRRQMVIRFNGEIAQKPDLLAIFSPSDMVDYANLDAATRAVKDSEIAIKFPPVIVKTEFETELRLRNDELRLNFSERQIKDAVDHWVVQGKRTRVADLAREVGMGKGVPTAITTAADPMWLALATKVFDTSDMSPDLVIAVLKKFIWSTKRKLAGLDVTNHLMPVILGPQGSGKSTFVTKLTAPIAELMINTDFDEVTDNRNIDLWGHYVLFMDEMGSAKKADIDKTKNRITSPTVFLRPMRENTQIPVPNRATFIGCSNRELDQLITDNTGNRRFFALRMPTDACRKTVNAMDFDLLWRSVDLHAADPMDNFRPVVAKLQEDKRVKSSVEAWATAFRPDAPSPKGDFGHTFADHSNGNRILATNLFLIFSEWEAVHYPGSYRMTTSTFGAELQRLIKDAPAGTIPFKIGPRIGAGNTYEYTGNVPTPVLKKTGVRVVK